MIDVNMFDSIIYYQRRMQPIFITDNDLYYDCLKLPIIDTTNI